MNEIYLTTEGLKKLEDELSYLKTVKKRELSKAIGEAREHGDLKENAEYHAAKEEQGRTEARIRFLETQIAMARPLEKENLPDNIVCIGAKVQLKNLDSNSELTYTIVSPVEANTNSGRISITSPVAKGLLGKKVGNIAEINIPAGLLRYEILNISR